MTTPRRWRPAPVPEILRRVDLTVRRRIHGIREGDHLALVVGRGVEAAEARPYSPGDDVRRIDWTVTARTGVPHVRDAQAERELDVVVLVDLSGSLDFGTVGARKVDLALDVLAAVTSLATRGHDRVGALLLNGHGIHPVPVRAGRPHLAALLARAEREAAVGGGADLAGGIARLGALARRRGLVVIVSDFMGPLDWERPLAAIARRHDTIAVELVDPRDVRLPDVGYLTVVDTETGRRRTVDTASPELRARFAGEADRRRALVAATLARTGTSHLRLWTGADWVADLARFLDGRRRSRTVGHVDVSLPPLPGASR
jgi:uncharacterized protein (DUF58 family)